MSHHFRVATFLSAALALLPVSLAHAQNAPLDPYPHRESKLISGFETGVEGWTSTPTANDGGEATDVAASNDNPTFASQGTESLKLDFTGRGGTDGWEDAWMQATLPEPVDITGYGYLSMDIFVPDGSIGGGWYQYGLHLTGDGLGGNDFANRDLHTGWNRFVWALRPQEEETTSMLAGIRFDGGFNSNDPYTGPVYIDNVRVWKGLLPGLKSTDERLIAGFESDAEFSDLVPGAATETSINADAETGHIQGGTGSLLVDMTGGRGGGDYAVATLAEPRTTDVEKAKAFLVDIYIPGDSFPSAGWGQNGLRVNYINQGDTTASFSTASYGMARDMWDTIELDISPEQAAQIKSITGFQFNRNSQDDDAGNWRGPIYFDNFRMVVTPDATVKPDAPAGLTATGGDGKVNLSWNPANNAASYTVKRGTAAGGPYTPANAAPITGTTYSDTTVTNGTAYYYVVVGVNTLGESPVSNEASATPTVPAQPPAAPANLKATTGNGFVDLKWDTVTGATGYTVKRAQGTGGPYTPVNATPIAGNALTDSSVTNGVTYYYVVTAVNGAGESPNSAEVTVQPKSDPVLNPYPYRENKLLFGFEGGAEGWASTPVDPETNLASVNTDTKFVSDGVQSLKAEFTNLGSTNTLFAATIDEPIDITGYHYLSMDIYVPRGGLGTGWYQFLLNANTDNGNSNLGNRDLHEGWNRFTWQLSNVTDPEAATSLTGLSIGSSMDTARPYMTPIYIDNVRVWKNDQFGAKADEQLINGFDTQTDVDEVAQGDAAGVSLNTEADFKQAGAGSLAVDLTDVAAYGANYALTTLPEPLDATKATAFLIDILIPGTSRADSWYQNGIRVNYQNPANPANTKSINTATYGFKTDQWDTIEIDLTPQQAAEMSAVTGFEFSKGGGSNWHGPIYFDNLRMVVPPATTGGCKGDANGDTKVDVNDAVAVLRHATGIALLTGQNRVNADVNGDGSTDAGVNVEDAVKVLQYIVGIPNTGINICGG